MSAAFKVGDRVCTWGAIQDSVGTVVDVEFNKRLNCHFYSVKWDKTNVGRQGLCTHPDSADDLWLQGQPSKETPESKDRKKYIARQIETDAALAIERAAFESALDTYVNRCKYNVGDCVYYPSFTVGVVVEAAPYNVKVKFAENFVRQIDTFSSLRHADSADIKVDVLQIAWQPEPEFEDATLDDLQKEIEAWANIVLYLDCDDDQDEILHDLFSRECIHGYLNSLNKKCIIVPNAMLEQLNKADQVFKDNSMQLGLPELTTQDYARQNAIIDPIIFWYQYRWPKYKL